MSTPLHHLSYRRLSVLICLQAPVSFSSCFGTLFWHLNLRRSYPSSYCIPHAIIKCRMTNFISYIPCLAARFFPLEDCSIRPLSLLVCAVLYVITFTPSFMSSPECADLSPGTCQPLFMFLNLILRCLFRIASLTLLLNVE